MVGGMKQDAVRIDWQTAIKQFEDLLGKSNDLEIVNVILTIKKMNRMDDIAGYLDVYEKNKYLLKKYGEK